MSSWGPVENIAQWVVLDDDKTLVFLYNRASDLRHMSNSQHSPSNRWQSGPCLLTHCIGVDRDVSGLLNCWQHLSSLSPILEANAFGYDVFMAFRFGVITCEQGGMSLCWLGDCRFCSMCAFCGYSGRDFWFWREIRILGDSKSFQVVLFKLKLGFAGFCPIAGGKCTLRRPVLLRYCGTHRWPDFGQDPYPLKNPC